MQPYPLGVYKEPPPQDVGAIKGYNIGNSGVAKLSRKLTSAVTDVNKFLDSINPLP